MLNAALYLGIILLWGFTWIAIKHSVGSVAPEICVIHRFAIAATIMLGIAFIQRQRLKFPLKQHLLMAALGATICCFNFVFFYHAAQHMTSGLNAIVFSTSVIMIMVNHALFFKKYPTSKMLAGGVIGCLGLCTIFLPELRAFQVTESSLLGLCLALAGSYCFSWGNIISAKCSEQGLPLISSTFYAMFYGTLISSVYSLILSIPFHCDFNLTYAFSLSYLAIPGSVIGFLTYLSLVRRIGPEKAIFTTLFFPLVALFVSTFAESFHWTWKDIAGVSLILVGNSLVLIKPKKTKPLTSPWVEAKT